MLLKETIQEKIRSGALTMKPKVYFVLRGLLYLVGMLLVLGLTFYLIGFIAFMFRANGVFILPEFGLRGVRTLFVSLPWFLIVLVVVLVIILELLSRHFFFVYRWPIVYSLLGFVVVLGSGGALLGQLSIHESMMRLAEERSLPFAGPLYRHFGRMHFPDGHIGTILATSTSGFSLLVRDGNIYAVMVTPGTRFPHGQLIMPDDVVMVMGLLDDERIEAFGIRKIDDVRVMMPRPPFPSPFLQPR